MPASRTKVAGVALAAALVSACASGPGGDGTATEPRPIDESGKIVLFGDLHTHTTISLDAAIRNLPVQGGAGFEEPAKACAFARYCSALDFWSINDHAEHISEAEWTATKEAIRECNALHGGETRDPSMVSFLGWEWTQIDADWRRSFGHRNVVLRDTADADVPARPIGARSVTSTGGDGLRPEQLLFGLLLLFDAEHRAFNEFTVGKMLASLGGSVCPEGIPVRDLPPDCREQTPTTAGLFAKLDDWGFPALVIPHGSAWGSNNPPLHNWRDQLTPANHDPARERLIEVYSGHGNSERWRPWLPYVESPGGEVLCPEPSADFEPCCWRAGEIVRARDPACLADGRSDACDEAVARGRRRWIEGSTNARNVFDAAYPDAPTTDEEWLDCDQCRDCGFNAAFNYRPRGSVQAALALGNFDAPGAGPEPLRYRFGLIGSTDDHAALPGSGYKEGKRYTDHRGPVNEVGEAIRPALAATFGDMERKNSFYFSGALVAVHAANRSREAIWDALGRKEAYATSGKRILLWFDALVPGRAEPAAMGETITASRSPRFRVKALGDWVQAPGCPRDVHDAIGPDLVERICLGDCYRPTAERQPIDRIEVVRIRPQRARDEPLDRLIDDPWRVFDCPGDSSGCEASFDDPEFAAAARSALYYVRALHPPTPVFNADGLRCEGLEGTACRSVRPCFGGRRGDGDDCMGVAQDRAWSSPIYVDWAPEQRTGATGRLPGPAD